MTPRIPRHCRGSALRAYYRSRGRYYEQGLNSKGRPYKRTPNLSSRTRPAHQRRVNLAKYHRRAQAYFAQGLNSRGKPRRYNLVSPIEQAWRALRATFHVPDPDYLTPAERCAL